MRGRLASTSGEKMDDDAGWDAILVDGWGPLVRHAVVERVERATVGARGTLVRTLADPEHARFAWTEWLHECVVDAIRYETGADLDRLGSQAAWACYEDSWDALACRWRDGGSTVVVRPGAERRVRRLLAEAPAWLAERAGADIGALPPEPLVVGGRVRLDVEGVAACLRREDIDRRTAVIASALLACVR
jgi:hypothetical protein